MPDLLAKEPVTLKRSMSLLQLSFYGIGSILGAGIYVLLGEVVNVAGMQTPLAFLLAAIVVSPSVYSYSQLARRFPVSAGEAVYVMDAFGWRLLSQVVGLSIVMAGVVSSATLLNGFTGYFDLFIDLPDKGMVVALTLLLFLISAWGITQSVFVAVVTTLLEILGLVLVIWVTHSHWHNVPWQQIFPDVHLLDLKAVTAAGFLAFYAFIGFEDMVNMSEEVKNPTVNMPVGIVIAFLVTLTLYLLTAISALVSVPLGTLAASSTPMALVIELNSDIPLQLISLISLVAIINGAMIQMIMASRVLYGLASQGLFIKSFAKINAKTHTPLTATTIVALLILVSALALPLVRLAELTSTFILLVFFLVNLALLTINLRDRSGGFFKFVIPGFGVACSAGMLLYNLLM